MSDLKYKNLVETSAERYGSPTEPSTEYYPEVRLNLDKLPGLDDVTVGDTAEICFKCKVVSVTKTETESCVRVCLTGGNVLSVTASKKSAAIKKPMPKNEVDQILTSMESYNPRY